MAVEAQHVVPGAGIPGLEPVAGICPGRPVGGEIEVGQTVTLGRAYAGDDVRPPGRIATVEGEPVDLRGSQHAVVDTNVVDRAGEPAGRVAEGDTGPRL